MQQGLTTEQVEASRLEHGSNILTPPKKEPLWKLFLEKFNDPVIRILIVAAFLSLGIGFVHNEFFETIGIFVAIFLSTGIAFFFERDAQKKFDILNKINEDTLYKVYRDGQLRQVGKRELVVGDVMLLDTGEEIPADAMLLEATALKVNESTLTGEPSIRKTTIEADFKADSTYPDNEILRSTTIIEGNCLARIIKVGDATEFGKVARQASEKSPEITPLTRQLDRLAKLIGVGGFTLAFLTFTLLLLKDILWGDLSAMTLGQTGLLGAALLGVFVMMAKVWVPIVYDAIELFTGRKKVMNPKMAAKGWAHWVMLGAMIFVGFSMIGMVFGVRPLEGDQWITLDQANSVLSYFMISVTLIVVAVPEGLPMSVTLSLALSMRKMLKAGNLVRKMHASETIGATTVICTDKTGTLTRNQMNVSEIHAIDDSLLHKSIALNTTANLDADGAPLGNPTEGALLMWLKDQGVDYKEHRVEILGQMPFSSALKMMATVATVDGKDILFVKGAPEYVLERCTLTADERKALNEKLVGYQNRAMRTLAFARRELDNYDLNAIEESISGLAIEALSAISDPVRDDVPAAVTDCFNAGIAIKVVTGDTPATAREIARQIGLWNDEVDGAVNEITGPEWEALSDEEAYERAAKLKIMARARPMDKQRLVQLLQKRGEIVAVTGDGTNDAPALNFANVGLSMGSGTSVAKEASDITLTNDSFATIATAVMWGRSVYLNIQRFVLFQLTINVAALSIVFIGSMLGFELPLTVTQMLWVNLIMDTFAAGALASLPPDRRVMDKKPRSSSAFIITPKMGRSILVTGFLFVGVMLGLLFGMKAMSVDGELTGSQLSLFFTIFVMLQFWNMFNAKAYATGRSALNNLKNCKGFLVVSLLIIVGQILIVSFGGKVFRVVPLSLAEWGLAIGATSLVLLLPEVWRLLGGRARKANE
ncbi:MAG: cation-translocating P-type ATPase [Mucinivorans sp.]